MLRSPVSNGLGPVVMALLLFCTWSLNWTQQSVSEINTNTQTHSNTENTGVIQPFQTGLAGEP